MTQQDFQMILKLVELGEKPSLTFEAEGETYTRRFAPRDRLILLGGGHVAKPLCEFAAALDFDVTVVDDRPLYANRERFPLAHEIVCDEFRSAVSALAIRRSDYVCVLTRGHRWDGECMRAILSGTIPSYLGMIGSVRRVEGMFSALAEEGYDEKALLRIHAPIGLPIGAVTPAEIAVSICAQLVEHRHELPRENGEALTQQNTDLGMLRFLALDKGPKAVCVVLDSDNSTPVKSGAMMACDALGHSYGTIGGGAGEAAALTRARSVIGTGGSCVMEVDMTGDAAAEDGLVCGGTMQVFIRDIGSGA